MTRNEIINELERLNFEEPVSKYLDIRDFLHYNRTPIKAVQKVTVSNYFFDGTPSTARLYLVDSNGNDWGSVEW